MIKTAQEIPQTRASSVRGRQDEIFKKMPVSNKIGFSSDLSTALFGLYRFSDGKKKDFETLSDYFSKEINKTDENYARLSKHFSEIRRLTKSHSGFKLKT
ncbi:MAG: hypothetical protein Q8R08_01755 [bacterium]|nr:hypothetical protein [bacterium]